MRKRLTMLLASLFLLVGMALAQTQISGTVIASDDGEPVIGASVKVVGTTQGTVTDINGKFSISVPANTKLEISYVGMQSKIIMAQSGMLVKLDADNKTLDEVMVVAYGKAKKSAFTGSAGVVDASKIANRQVSNITQALSGSVAGVQVVQPSGKPGATATVRIRGIGSIASSNTPLYVVDGVPYDGDISAINPSDIASTTVLKDAAANALYGARGANGVVLLTTKSGTNKDAEVTVDIRLGNESRAVPNYNVITDPRQYMEMAYQAIYNSVYGTAGYTTEAAANARANEILSTTDDGGVGYKIFTVPTGENLIGTDGKINPNATLGYNDGTYTYLPDNWYDEVYNKGNLRQEYNASIAGSKDRMTYYVSAGYLNDEGIIRNAGFERFTSRAKFDYQVKPWFKFTTNLSYTHYNSKYSVTNTTDYNKSSSANLFYVANFMAPIYPLYVRDANGNIMTDSNGFTIYDFGDGKGLTGYQFQRPFMSGSNPASTGELDRNKFSADVFSGRWGAEFKIIEGLKFTYNLGYDTDNTRRGVLRNAYYGQYAGQGGIVTQYATRETSINNQQLLTYDKEFGNHTLDILLGHETYSWKKNDLNAERSMLFQPMVIELDNGIKTPQNSSSTDTYSTEGWFTRVQYDYLNKYFASVSYRRDASSRFAKENRWGNFGSFGGAWVITKEKFMEPTKHWLTFLKYKLSYGIQGNDALLTQDGYKYYYPYTDIYTVSNNNDQFAVALTRKGNKNITWETSYSFNTGFDFNLWNDKLSGSIEYYNRTTDDLLYYMPVAVSNGYSVFPTNIGKVRNYGVEIDLNSKVYQNADVRVDVFANATTTTNKIIKLAPELNGTMTSGNNIYAEGESMYQYYIREYAGVYNGDASELATGQTASLGQALYWQDVTDANGNVERKKTANWSTATRYKQGDRLPDVYGGFGVRVAAYGFDFSLSAAYQLGGKCWDYGYQQLMHGGNSNSAGTSWHKDVLNAWTTANTSSSTPRLNANDNYTNSTSDRFIVSSDYLSLTNISLGYSFSKKILDKIGLTGLRLYVTADNVALLAARKGLDPRQSFGQSTNMQYSSVRTISGGLTVKF